jgi:hypothetical protein
MITMKKFWFESRLNIIFSHTLRVKFFRISTLTLRVRVRVRGKRVKIYNSHEKKESFWELYIYWRVIDRVENLCKSHIESQIFSGESSNESKMLMRVIEWVKNLWESQQMSQIFLTLWFLFWFLLLTVTPLIDFCMLKSECWILSTYM